MFDSKDSHGMTLCQLATSMAGVLGCAELNVYSFSGMEA